MKKISRILKKIFLTIGIILFVIILAIIILHEVLLTPRFVKKQVIRIFKKTFNKDIKLDRIDVSLVRGIEIDNVILFNPEYSSKRIFFKIDKLRIKYNLFYLLLLKIKIDEILFDNPYIFIEYNNKLRKWNFDEYVKPSEKKEKEEEEEKKEPGSPLKIDIELKSFVLKNFTFEFKKDFYFKLTGINYTANLKMDETSLQGINSASFKFFNTGNKNITFYNNTTKVIMPLNLNIDLDIKNNKDGKLKLTYNLNNQLIELNEKFFTLPDININFDSNLILKDSTFLINQFLVEVNKNTVVNIQGKILKFDSAPDILITMKENSLNLKDFENYIKVFSNQENLKVDGIFKTSKFVFKKNSQKKLPLIMGQIELNNVNFSIADNISLNNLNFSAGFKMDEAKHLRGDISLNIENILANIIEVKNFNLNSSVSVNPNNELRSFNLNIDGCKINNADFKTEITYKNKELNGEITLTDMDLSGFNRAISGNLSLTDKIKSSDLNNFKNSLNINIPDFKLIAILSNKYYYSKDIPVILNTEQNFNLKTKDVVIQFVDLRVSDFISFLFTGNFKNNIFNGSIDEFNIVTQNIIDKLPENIVYNLPFQTFNGIINTTGKINFQNNKLIVNILTTNRQLLLENRDGGFKINNLYSSIKATSRETGNIVDYEFSISDIQNKIITYNSNIKDYEIRYEEFLDQINLIASVIAGKDMIDIRKVSLTIPNINFDFNLAGKVITKPQQDINIRADLKFQPDKELRFLNNGRLNGSLNMITTVNSDLADNSLLIDGKILFNNLSFFMKDIIIDKIDGYFPFRHIQTASKLDRKMLASKSAKNDLQLLNYSLNRAYISKPDNFTINKIKIGDINIDKFAFDMEYKDNMLSLKKGYMEVMDGSITINNSFFDLGNLSPDTFRYKFNLEISGIDIRNLPMVKGVKKDENTKIFANIRISGKGIDLQKSGDIYGAFNFTEIGDAVAAKLLASLDPKGKDGNISYVKSLLYGGAWCELLTLEIKYGRIISRIWLNKAPYMIWIPLPPSPIEFKDKSLDVILQSFKKSEEG